MVAGHRTGRGSLNAVSSRFWRVGPQGAAADVSDLRIGTDRSWRSEEHSADGGAACAGEYDQLHHFIAAGVWDAKPLETELLVQADKLVGGRDAVLVIDDTAIPKKGTHSVGVAAQYASASGQDSQLPDPHIADIGARRSPGHAGVAAVSSRELDGQPSSVAPSGCPGRVSNSTNEAGVGSAGDRSRHCGWCALWLRLGGCRLRTERTVPPGAHSAQTGLGGRYSAAPQGISCQCADDLAGCQARPSTSAARPRHSIIPAEEMLTEAKWHTISWRTGTKGKLKARFAAVRVRVADGPPQRIRDKGQQHLPGDEAWLIGEHRMSGEKKYYLANLSAKTDLRTLAATIKARWICEQAHQQLKEELGLDHFEGRSWQGLHRHTLMTMIAYAFLQHRRLKTARRKKKNQWTATSTNLARRAPSHRRIGRSATTAAMPVLQKMDLRRKQRK